MPENFMFQAKCGTCRMRVGLEDWGIKTGVCGYRQGFLRGDEAACLRYARKDEPPSPLEKEKK